jgi:hypothetical protein
MVALANPVNSQQQFWELLIWTRERRGPMACMFFLHTCYLMLGMSSKAKLP